MATKAEDAPSGALQAPPQAPRRLRGLRSTLLTLMLVALLPALSTAAYAVWQAGESFRKATLSSLSDTTRALAQNIEDDLSAKAVLLQAVAGSVQNEYLPLPDAAVWLERLLGHPASLSLEPDSAAAVESPAAAGEPQGPQGVRLSDLQSADDAQGAGVQLSVPLRQTDGGPARLSLRIEARHLLRIAPQAGASDSSLLIAVTDGLGHIVARSRDGERFIGRPVPDWPKLKALRSPSGQFEATTAEGQGVMLSFTTLAHTPGWVLVVGEPLGAFNTRWQQPLRHLAIGGGLGMLVALWVAWRLSRQIIGPVQALQRNARAVAEGGDAMAAAEVRNFPIAEFESMRQSIESAQHTLQRQAQIERDNAQAIAAGELRYRTLVETGAVVLWRGCGQGRLVAAAGWERLTGRAEAEALDEGWRRFVHAEDLPIVDSMLAEAAAAQRVDAEFRIGHTDGGWRWMRSRGAAVHSGDGPAREWVGVLEDVDERRQAHARIAHMAHHDALTGLPNRIEFRLQLEAAIRRTGRGERAALLYIDLDRFKQVNDSHGHPVGDALLLAVTQRLRSLVRESDTVGRLAGDEFAIVQSRISGPADAADLAHRVVSTLSAPYELAAQRVEIGASVGIMLIDSPEDEAEQLLKFADMALYRAKQDGRGRHHFFDPQMDQRMQQRRRQEQELRAAVEAEDFELHYRPLVGLPDRRLSGVSAELCWRHPSQGTLAAPAFWALAVEFGLDGRLMAWMLERLCADLARWPAAAKGALDVSALLPRWAGALPEWVDAALQRSGLSPARLELEIDERALGSAAERLWPLLRQLKQRGVRVAMARFGADDSTLGLLRRFPFDMVKLDSTIVHDLGQQKAGDAIARAVAKLCDDLGILTAAAGVDNEGQLNLLSAEYCAEVQGAMFGGPGRLDELLGAQQAEPLAP